MHDSHMMAFGVGPSERATAAPLELMVVCLRWMGVTALGTRTEWSCQRLLAHQTSAFNFTAISMQCSTTLTMIWSSFMHRASSARR